MTYLPADFRYDSMQYRRSGRSGLQLPAITLGLWYNFGGVDAFENGRSLIQRAFDLGITHFDLANNYGPPPGSAEETFGRILAKDLASYRDELVISSKAGYDMFDRWIEDGLLDVLADEGIGCIGFSPLAQGILTDKYLQGLPEDSRGAKYKDELHWGDQVSQERIDKVRRLNKLAQTRGQSMAQMAVAWILRQPQMTSALIGASKIRHIEEAVAALDNLVFPDEELVQIDAILAG